MEKTIEIPEGYEARIEGNKVILEPKESEDERIRKWLIKFVEVRLPDAAEFEPEYRAALAWLERTVNEENISFALATQVLAKYGYSFILNEDLAELRKHKPAEWSEEDENRFNNLCWIIDDNTHWNEASKQGFKNFLNSLRSRYCWKPSEEQMEALRCAVNDSIMQYDYNASQLKEEVARTYSENLQSLLNDLNKL